MNTIDYVAAAKDLRLLPTQKDVGIKYGIAPSDMSKIVPILKVLNNLVDDMDRLSNDLQQQNNELQQQNKLLLQQDTGLQQQNNELQQQNNELQQQNRKLQREVATLKNGLSSLQENCKEMNETISSYQDRANSAIVPQMLNRFMKQYFGVIDIGNFIVTTINLIEGISIFACCMYIMPTMVLGMICGTMMSSILWYAQSIIKNPKYISASTEFMFIAFVVMLLSIATHYATFYKQGGLLIGNNDITIVVSIVIPSLSFASLWLRNVQAKQDYY